MSDTTFTVTFKTPDAAHYAVEDLPEDKRPAASELLQKFLQYGETVTVKFDLEKQSAEVLPAGG